MSQFSFTGIITTQKRPEVDIKSLKKKKNVSETITANLRLANSPDTNKVQRRPE